MPEESKFIYPDEVHQKSVMTEKNKLAARNDLRCDSVCSAITDNGISFAKMNKKSISVNSSAIGFDDLVSEAETPIVQTKAA